MFNPAQQGFGRYASNIGFKALGAAPGLNYEAAAELGSAALAAKAKIKAAKYQADATRYQGRQARNAAIFGGAMDLVGSLGGAAIGKMAQNKAYLNERYGSPSTKPYPSDKLPPVFPGPVTPPTPPPPVPQSFYGGYGGF